MGRVNNSHVEQGGGNKCCLYSQNYQELSAINKTLQRRLGVEQRDTTT